MAEETRTDLEQVDIIVPTYLTLAEVSTQVAEIAATAGMPCRVFATCKKLSASENRNLGLGLVGSNIIIMTDDDTCDFDHGWASSLVKTLEQNPRCVMVSPQLMRPGRVGYAFMMGCPQGMPYGSKHTRITRTHMLTACVAIRRDSLRFNTGFRGSGFEDNEYCDQQNREYPNGFRLVNHGVQVVHRNEMKNQQENNAANRKLYESLKEPRQ